MDEIIRQKCEALGISPDVLTPEERNQLIEEIIAEKRGKSTLDGVLNNPELYYRGMKRN